MAVIHDGVKIYQGFGTDSIVLGITSSFNESEIIVTKLRSVETFKVGDTKPLSSWSTKLLLPFSCPVIYSRSSNEFVGICNQRSLAKWTYEIPDLSTRHFKEVGSNVKALLTLGEAEEEPTVLFCNGYIEGLCSVSDNRKKPRGSKLLRNEEIINHWLTKESQTVNVVLLTGRVEGYQLLIIPLPCEDGGTAFRCSLKKPTEDTSICDSCFYQDKDLSKLFVLWSDGSIWSYHLESVMMQEGRSSHLEGQRILKLPSGNNMSKLRIEVIHADYIAVSGITSLDSQTSEKLSIWSIPYGTLQGHVAIPTSTESADKEDRGSRCLVSLYYHLVSATPSSLTCHLYHCESGTLAQALGKLSVDHSKREDNFAIKWSTNEKDHCESSLDILHVKETVLGMILGPKKMSTTLLQKEVHSLQTHSPSSILDILKKVAEDFQTREKKKWLPGKMIEIVIKMSKVAGSACPEFLSVVLEFANANLMLVCLEYMQDLPEPFVVKSLEIFLSIEESKIPTTLAQNGEHICPSVDKLCPLSPKQAWCINKVMGCPFNTIFLLSSMKKVPFDLILLFLRYLLFLVSKDCHWSNGELSDESIIDWISVTLDAHFTQLILTPEAKEILVSLQSHVHQHVEFYSEVNAVNRFVQAITKTVSISSKDIRDYEESRYSVEFMSL